VLGDGEVAVEVKGTDRVDRHDVYPIRRFVAEYTPRAAYIVCNEPEERLEGGIRITPGRTFQERLWEGGIMPLV
jgi:hypothetical protein